MRIISIARKSFLEIIREPQLLLLVLLMPVAFVGIAYTMYNTPLLSAYPLLVINHDPSAEDIIQDIENQRYPNGKPIFKITPVIDRAMAEEALKKQKTSGLITFFPDASKNMTNVVIKGDALYQPFIKASVILDAILIQYIQNVTGRPEVIKIVEQSQTKGKPQNDFDLYAPGMMIFALLMLIPQTAFLVAREIRWGTFRRLRLTRMSSWEYLGGICVSQMIFAVILVGLVLLTAIFLGFQNQGSFLTAIVIGLIICFSAVGQGLIVACFVENDSQANNVGSTVTMFQVFMSGSFYAMPPITLFTLAGHQIDLFDFIPASHGFLALQQVLSYGADISEVGFRIAVTIFLSLFYFIIGVFIFNRTQMQHRS